MVKFEANNINELYKGLIQYVHAFSDYTSKPRGMEVSECLNVVSVLTNPLDCLTTIANRKLNYRFSIIEKMEYLYGKHDPERIIAYNKNMASFKGAYGYFDGNYAERFNYWLQHIYLLLKNDNDTRQAVISIYGMQDRHQSKDIPCTVILHFLLRGGKLNLTVYMRSNDLLWGFPYDVNAFCFIQEVMASWLNVQIGEYTHIVGSMHIYSEPKENHDQLLSCANFTEVVDVKNPVWNLNYEQTLESLPIFFAAEKSIRLGTKSWIELEKQLPECLKIYFDKIKSKWILKT